MIFLLLLVLTFVLMIVLLLVLNFVLMIVLLPVLNFCAYDCALLLLTFVHTISNIVYLNIKMQRIQNYVQEHETT